MWIFSKCHQCVHVCLGAISGPSSGLNRFFGRSPLPVAASTKERTTATLPPTEPILIDEAIKDRVVARVVANGFRQYGECHIVCKDRNHLRKALRVLAMALSVVGPDVWVSFREVGKIVEVKKGDYFRGLQFTLKGGLGGKIESSGHKTFQVGHLLVNWLLLKSKPYHFLSFDLSVVIQYFCT